MIRVSPFGKAMIITVVAVFIAGIAVFALVVGFHAVNCIDDTLGARNGVTSRDAEAHIEDAQAAKTFWHQIAVPGASEKQKLAAFHAYVNEHDHYVRVLTADQAYRSTHPLGGC